MSLHQASRRSKNVKLRDVSSLVDSTLSEVITVGSELQIVLSRGKEKCGSWTV
jgi:hypothetical protein